MSCIVLDLGKLHFGGKNTTNLKRQNKLVKCIQYVVVNAMEKKETVKNVRHLVIFKIG